MSLATAGIRYTISQRVRVSVRTVLVTVSYVGICYYGFSIDTTVQGAANKSNPLLCFVHISTKNRNFYTKIYTAIYHSQNSIFGHVRRLQESVPAHEALRLVVNSCSGHRPDDGPAWKRPRGRPRQTWICQLEIDVGLTADAA